MKTGNWWNSKEIMEQMRDSVHHLLKGCSCKEGCNNKWCSWVRMEGTCGPGCSCCNCKNTDLWQPVLRRMLKKRKCRRIRLSGKSIEEDFSAIGEQEEDTSDRGEHEEDNKEGVNDSRSLWAAKKLLMTVTTMICVSGMLESSNDSMCPSPGSAVPFLWHSRC